MNRRDFLASATALSLIPLAARASEPVPYTPGNAEAAMDAGQIVLLGYWASWCPTCTTQARVLAEAMAENPAYGQAITVFSVDWDAYGTGDLAQTLAVPRRSTLVVLKGREEVGRLIAATSKAEIQALLDTALAAS